MAQSDPVHVANEILRACQSAPELFRSLLVVLHWFMETSRVFRVKKTYPCLRIISSSSAHGLNRAPARDRGETCQGSVSLAGQRKSGGSSDVTIKALSAPEGH
ncbi:hypothetical protein WMY93_029133 [Mugilogobius chulae]|uniref:Uncharacterized protein n=1 Tax=Mugilogobius chulae TaxID=88201 RepID=A0AAW0MUI6_9GOBI